MALRHLTELPEWCYDIQKSEFVYCGAVAKKWWEFWKRGPCSDIALFYFAVQAEWATEPMMSVADAIERDGDFSVSSPADVKLIDGWTMSKKDQKYISPERGNLIIVTDDKPEVVLNATDYYRKGLRLQLLLTAIALVVALTLWLIPSPFS